MALTLIELDTCSGCGQPVDESMDPAAEFAYQVDLVRCHACSAGDREVRRYSEAAKSDHALAGLFTRITRRGGPNG